MSANKKNTVETVPITSAPLTTPPSNAAKPSGYTDFLLEVKTQIRQRQLQALRAVNSEMLALYWWLGENISQRQAALGWGKAVVENLARDLQTEFPGRNGFSARNLWNMLDIYRDYVDKPKLQPLVAEISWSKNLLIMAKCKQHDEALYYVHNTQPAMDCARFRRLPPLAQTLNHATSRLHPRQPTQWHALHWRDQSLGAAYLAAQK